MRILSPYQNLKPAKWLARTKQLISRHPLKVDEIIDIVLLSWDSIFKSKIGSHHFRIGKHLFPKPQIMGFLLHELIPLEFQTRYPDEWRGDTSSSEKDLVYIPNNRYSIEIKTSSHKTQIFGNRSFAQLPTDPKKSKAGYYLAINFEGFKSGIIKPKIRKIRFGWLDHTDWIGQKSETGQQARLHQNSEQNKFLLLYETK